MSDTAGTTFFGILVLVTLAVAWWRIALLMLGVLLVSVLVYGVYEIMGVVERQSSHGVLTTVSVEEGSEVETT